jgi:hypothetical protein
MDSMWRVVAWWRIGRNLDDRLQKLYLLVKVRVDPLVEFCIEFGVIIVVHVLGCVFN